MYIDALIKTPQNEAAHASQAKNNAGGYVFQLDKWKALDRWLILGAEGGTYYAKEGTLTRENARTISDCLDDDGPRTVARIVEVSKSGRATKNDTAVFALALAASHGDQNTRQAAFAAVNDVCRIGTHIFQFAETVKHLRGWGRGLRRAVSKWYTVQQNDRLMYQVAKYGSRHGWSHRDLLRTSHPRAQSDAQNALFKYIVSGNANGIEYLEAFESLKTADEKTTIRLICEHGFTHEMIASHHKNSAQVWEALLANMPMTAMIRNLGKMTQVGLISPLSEASRLVSERLGDAEKIKAARVHPIAVLSALRTYGSGHGARGSLSWTPDQSIVAALDSAFYLAFGNVRPSGKRTLIALDVSGSMGWSEIAGVPGLTPALASVAMAMVTVRTEPQAHVVAFAGQMRDLSINASMSLAEVQKRTSGIQFGRTDCALPMLYAARYGLGVDAFQVWTDNETWFGNIHPHQALKAYRDKLGIASTLAVVGCTATDFTIADPSDAGMIDVVGFDTATPNLLASFAKGWDN